MKWTELLAPIVVFGLIVYEYIMNHKQYKEECEDVKKNLETEYAKKTAECEEVKEDVDKMIAKLSEYRLRELSHDYDIMTNLCGRDIEWRLNDGYECSVEVKITFEKWIEGNPKAYSPQLRGGYSDEHMIKVDCHKYDYGSLGKDIIKLILDKHYELEAAYKKKAEGK